MYKQVVLLDLLFWFKHILLNKKHIVNTNLQTFQAVDKNER